MRRQQNFTLKVSHGSVRYSRTIRASSYQEARWKAGVECFPPSTIWTLEPEPQQPREGQQMNQQQKKKQEQQK